MWNISISFWINSASCQQVSSAIYKLYFLSLNFLTAQLGIFNLFHSLWLRQELKDSLCLSICMSVLHNFVKSTQSSYFSLSGFPWVSLGSLSGLVKVALGPFSKHSYLLVGQTEPKILRLVLLWPGVWLTPSRPDMVTFIVQVMCPFYF